MTETTGINKIESIKMREFKVGDKVRRINNLSWKIKPGQVGTIVEEKIIGLKKYYYLDIASRCANSPENLELVKSSSKKGTKKMSKRGKLTKKDFETIKKLLEYLKKSEIRRLTGFSDTTIQTFSKMDKWEDYLAFKKEKNALFKEQRKAKKIANQAETPVVEILEDEETKGITTNDYFLREILKEAKETNRLLTKILLKEPKKGIFG